jgi:hypothetical protein
MSGVPGDIDDLSSNTAWWVIRIEHSRTDRAGVLLCEVFEEPIR